MDYDALIIGGLRIIMKKFLTIILVFVFALAFESVTAFAAGEEDLSQFTFPKPKAPNYFVYTDGDAGEGQHDDMRMIMVADPEVVTAAGLTKTMAPRTKETIKEYPLPKQKADVRDFYRNVIKAIAGEEEQLVKHAEVMRVMKLMEAIFESGEQNKVITDFEERCK